VVEPTVQLERLSKFYGARAALREVSLELGAGERLVLVGPNGAGKSTLLLILAGLLRPTAGEARVFGHALRRTSSSVRSRLGFLGHRGCLDDALSARENLLFYARLYGLEQGAARADELLGKLGLQERADEKLRGYSRGMRQRVALARALLHRPQLLLLDEPTSGLDEASAAALVELVRDQCAAPASLVIATHDLELGAQLASRVLVLRAGQVVMLATRDQIESSGAGWQGVRAAAGPGGGP
jgi:heme ABC exporter ATP-binding subunit CcmA